MIKPSEGVLRATPSPTLEYTSAPTPAPRKKVPAAKLAEEKLIREEEERIRLEEMVQDGEIQIQVRAG